MRIENVQLLSDSQGSRVQARVIWEDCDQPERLLFIETTKAFAPDLEPSWQAFVVGCLIPAMHFQEQRLAVDGEVCPWLLEGLQTAMALIRHWSKGVYAPLRIEPRRIQQDGASIEPRHRAGMFYSGGIDSLAALRLNQQHYPPAHPGLIRDCFFVHGFDIGGVPARGMKYHVFDRGLAAMEAVMAEAGTTAVPVYTNIRHLCDERDLWLNYFFAAVLAAVAHAFRPRLDVFSIASSHDLEHLVPCGSHPLLDPEYSSFALRIRHRDAGLSRLEKLRIVAGWECGLQNMRVCLANVPDRLNCGRCEKCVRTMTGLVALDALHTTRAFEEDDVRPEMFEPFAINIRHRGHFYAELLPLLEARGRDDLVRTIGSKLPGFAQKLPSSQRCFAETSRRGQREIGTK